jgi:hypothetical protein
MPGWKLSLVDSNRIGGLKEWKTIEPPTPSMDQPENYPSDTSSCARDMFQVLFGRSPEYCIMINANKND